MHNKFAIKTLGRFKRHNDNKEIGGCFFVVGETTVQSWNVHVWGNDRETLPQKHNKYIQSH